MRKVFFVGVALSLCLTALILYEDSEPDQDCNRDFCGNIFDRIAFEQYEVQRWK